LRLTKVEIDSFRTIATHQEIEIDPRITVLIGANESGKTNLLEAIKAISLEIDFKHDDITKCKNENYTGKIFPTLCFHFLLSGNELAELIKTIPDLENYNTIAIRKNSNGIDGYTVAIPKEQIILSSNSRIDQETKLLKELTEKLDISKKELSSLREDDRVMQKRIEQIVQRKENGSTLIFKALKVKERINQLEAEINENNIEATSLSNDISKWKGFLKRPEDLPIKISPEKLKRILDNIPKVQLLKNLEVIPETIPISELLNQKTPRAISIGRLLSIGGLDNLLALNYDSRTVRAILKNTSKKISKRLSECWKQEAINLEIEKDTDNISLSISDGIAISSAPYERSEGFQWFLSFFSNFMTSSVDSLTIVLLDEPAIQLHPRGQKDVLQMLEQMSVGNQLIYTSHSPFLINRNFPHRIRVLEKDSTKGTIIKNKPYSDGKTRFWEPLKTSIGIGLGDLFSMNEVNLIVEGISDQIFISHMSNELARLNEPFLDLQKIAIVPAMGASCIEYLSRFAYSEHFVACSLLDNDSEGKRIYEKLKNEKGSNMILLNSAKKEAITIEDLIPVNIYVNAVNSFYSKIKGYKEFKTTNENNLGIIEQLKKHFKEIDISFDKVSIAKEVVKLLEIRKENLEDYSSFKQLFEKINNQTQTDY
jgi:predicted ATP-dependent endonuclease of OLD family